MSIGSNTEYVAQKFEVTFKNGYSKSSAVLKCKCKLRVGQGKEEWGAEKRKRVLHIRDKRSKGGND